MAQDGFFIEVPELDQVQKIEFHDVPESLAFPTQKLLSDYAGKRVGIPYLAGKIARNVSVTVDRLDYLESEPPRWRFQLWVTELPYLTGPIAVMLFIFVMAGYVGSSQLEILGCALSLLVCTVIAMYFSYWYILTLERIKILSGGINKDAFLCLLAVWCLSLMSVERFNVLNVPQSTLILVDLVLSLAQTIVILYSSLKRRSEITDIPQRLDDKLLRIMGHLSMYLSEVFEGNHRDLVNAILDELDTGLSGGYQFTDQYRADIAMK